MDNEPIFTEYELEVKKARKQANRLTHDAVLDPETMTFVSPADIAKRDKENVDSLKKWGSK